jgi:hypothetical protein
MAQWYGIYDDTSKDVEGAGFFTDPDTVSAGLDAGKSLTVGQAGDIPNDLIAEDGTKNYTYNTGNNTVEAKA